MRIEFGPLGFKSNLIPLNNSDGTSQTSNMVSGLILCQVTAIAISIM